MSGEYIIKVTKLRTYNLGMPAYRAELGHKTTGDLHPKYFCGVRIVIRDTPNDAIRALWGYIIAAHNRETR